VLSSNKAAVENVELILSALRIFRQCLTACRAISNWRMHDDLVCAALDTIFQCLPSTFLACSSTIVDAVVKVACASLTRPKRQRRWLSLLCSALDRGVVHLNADTNVVSLVSAIMHTISCVGGDGKHVWETAVDALDKLVQRVSRAGSMVFRNFGQITASCTFHTCLSSEPAWGLLDTLKKCDVDCTFPEGVHAVLKLLFNKPPEEARVFWYTMGLLVHEETAATILDAILQDGGVRDEYKEDRGHLAVITKIAGMNDALLTCHSARGHSCLEGKAQRAFVSAVVTLCGHC
jgi:hypothetical protein